MGTSSFAPESSMGCCEKLAAFQLIISCSVLGVAGCGMMTYGIWVMTKVTAWFAIFIFSVGGFMLLLSIYGACFGSKTAANRRLTIFMVLLILALLAQVVLSIWYVADPDVITDAADKSCHQVDVTANVTCSTNATSWCDASCTANTVSCCCACDQECQDCEADVQDTRDWVKRHSNFVAICLWSIVGLEMLALMSTYCKQSKASFRALSEPLLTGEEEEVPQTQEALEAKYGVSFQVFNKSGQSNNLDRAAEV